MSEFFHECLSYIHVQLPYCRTKIQVRKRLRIDKVTVCCTKMMSKRMDKKNKQLSLALYTTRIGLCACLLINLHNKTRITTCLVDIDVFVFFTIVPTHNAGCDTRKIYRCREAIYSVKVNGLYSSSSVGLSASVRVVPICALAPNNNTLSRIAYISRLIAPSGMEKP